MSKPPEGADVARLHCYRHLPTAEAHRQELGSLSHHIRSIGPRRVTRVIGNIERQYDVGSWSTAERSPDEVGIDAVNRSKVFAFLEIKIPGGKARHQWLSVSIRRDLMLVENPLRCCRYRHSKHRLVNPSRALHGPVIPWGPGLG